MVDFGSRLTPAAHSTSHESGGSDEIDATGLDPKDHASTHENAGSDEIDVSGLDPKAHKASHQDAGTDEIDATALVGRIKLDDIGDPGSHHYSKDTLTTSGNWENLDLSSLVGAGAKAILIRLVVRSSTLGAAVGLRKNGNSNTVNMSECSCLVSGQSNNLDCIVFCDANHIIDYRISNISWSVIWLDVGGWFV